MGSFILKFSLGITSGLSLKVLFRGLGFRVLEVAVRSLFAFAFEWAPHGPLVPLGSPLELASELLGELVLESFLSC